MWTEDQVREAAESLRGAATLVEQGHVQTARAIASGLCRSLPPPADEREDALWFALYGLSSAGHAPPAAGGQGTPAERGVAVTGRGSALLAVDRSEDGRYYVVIQRGELVCSLELWPEEVAAFAEEILRFVGETPREDPHGTRR